MKRVKGLTEEMKREKDRWVGDPMCFPVRDR